MRTRVYGGNWNKAKENGPDRDPGRDPHACQAGRLPRPQRDRDRPTQTPNRKRPGRLTVTRFCLIEA